MIISGTVEIGISNRILIRRHGEQEKVSEFKSGWG
jgi:hypothetical protein